jgi:hypothetical protein
MKVTLKNAIGKERVIGTCETEEEAWKIIKDFLKEHNFKSYYHRACFIDELNRYWIDVGSWTEFFYVYL